MPFIDVKTSVPMEEAQKESIKSRLGEAIRLIPGKSESWLMVGLEDNYRLYFKGNQDAPAAFVQVEVYGGENGSAFAQLTGEITNILHTELEIPADRIYVAYQTTKHWGWNGGNF